MRFPRAVMIRDDLSIEDCMTASAVLEAVRSEKKRKAEDSNKYEFQASVRIIWILTIC